MITPPEPNRNLDTLLRRAAHVVAQETPSALPALLRLAGEALGTENIAFYRLGPEGARSLLAGQERAGAVRSSA